MIVYALVEVGALLVNYLTGGWASVRLNLGLPLAESAVQLDSNLTWADIKQLGGEFLGLGLVSTIGFGIAALVISERQTLAVALRRFWPLAPKLILVSLISGLLVLAGVVLFIVPGVIASIWFLFAGYIAVLERRSVLESLRHSQRLTRGLFWPLLFRWLMVILLISALGLIINGVAIAGPLANALCLTPFSAVFTFELYLACLALKPANHD